MPSLKQVFTILKELYLYIDLLRPSLLCRSCLALDSFPPMFYLPEARQYESLQSKVDVTEFSFDDFIDLLDLLRLMR